MPRWWQRLHWPEYGAELLGTAFLVFAGLSAVTFVLGSPSPLAAIVPGSGLRRLIAGLLFAGCGSLVAVSPLGKLSGAHINPVVSLAFWLHGKMHRHDLAGYLAAQFVGAALGAAMLVLIWRDRAASIHNGITAPAAGYPIWGVFFMELGLTFLLLLAIFLFVSSHRLMRWTPLMTWFLVALIVWLEAPFSGTSLNPARSFGPALVSWYWQAQWLYFTAPPLGAALAVGCFRLLNRAGIGDVLTAKMFHAPHYRSIFKNCKAPQMLTDQDGPLVASRLQATRQR